MLHFTHDDDDHHSVEPPMSNAQLQLARNVMRELIKQRSVTYKQIAIQLGVDQEVLKSFCLGRSTRPRGDFLKKLAFNLKRLQPFTQENKNLNLQIKNLIIDVSSQEFNYSWHQGLAEFIGADDAINRKIIFPGDYALYRAFGSGKKIFKSRVNVEKVDDGDIVQRFTLHHKISEEKDRVSKGFILLFKTFIIMSATVGRKEGVFTIYAEGGGQTNHIPGIMTVAREGERIFSSRIVMLKVHNTDGEYGIITNEQMREEIGYVSQYVSNELDAWGLLEVMRT